MADSNLENQDQSLEDSTAMTIEFLRARLLSERSVSKSARQRADELEKKVEELEEQLRIVSLQRKMAEKATVDVLSILESRGISDPYEAFDSGSDHETNRESNEGSDCPNEEERSVALKRRSELEELSGSDHDSSPLNSRSLSWKGHTDSQRSCEKNRDPSTRRRNVFSLIGSSQKHHLGKSCRQNRHRDPRMVVEERKTEPVKFDSQENGVSQQSVPDFLGSVKNGRIIANHVDANGHVHEKDMEKALEHQAQLIGQYKEMEKAQREWEEKFRENNNSTPDSYDPGNHSDVTEERDETKVPTSSNMGTVVSETEEAKAEKVNVSIEPLPKLQTTNGFVPTLQVDIVGSMDKASSSANTVPRLQPQEFSFPTENVKESPVSIQNHSLVFHGPSSETGSSSHKGDLHALVPHNNPQNAVGSILEALKLAKLQLHHKMNQLPQEVVAPTSVQKATQSLLPYGTRIRERADISVGCTGLFRLPTDFAAEEADTRPSNFLGTVAGSTPDRFPPSPYHFIGTTAGSTPDRFPPSPYHFIGTTAGSTPDRFPFSPYIERRSERFPVDDRFLSSSSAISGSRASSASSLRFDPYFNSGQSSLDRYNHYSPQPFPDSMPVMPRIPTDEGFRRTFPGSTTTLGVAEDRMLFYGDHGRPNNMYR